MNIKILILGSNGFFGKNLKKSLKIGENHEIICIERKDVNISNKSELNLYFTTHKPTIVINCCGIVGSSESNKDNNQFYILQENINLNMNILDCCKDHNVSKLIMFSSYRLFNNYDKNIISYDEDNIHDYFDFNTKYSNIGYLSSKIVMDMQIKLFEKYYKTNIICLILPNIFGSDDNFCLNGRIIPSLIYKFKLAKEQNLDICISSSENNTVNLIYIKDLISIIENCIINNNINGNILIYNPNNNVNLKYLTDLMKLLFNFNNNIIFNDNTNTNTNTNNPYPNIEKFNIFFPNFKFSDLNSSLWETIEFYQKSSL
jgi:GDP-L-fucose synthase